MKLFPQLQQNLVALAVLAAHVAFALAACSPEVLLAEDSVVLESRVYLSCFSKPRAGSQGCNLAVHRMKAVQLRLSAELLSSTEAPAPERGGAEPLSPPRARLRHLHARMHGRTERRREPTMRLTDFSASWGHTRCPVSTL